MQKTWPATCRSWPRKRMRMIHVVKRAGKEGLHGESVHSLVAGRSVHITRRSLVLRCLLIRRRVQDLVHWAIQYNESSTGIIEDKVSWKPGMNLVP